MSLLNLTGAAATARKSSPASTPANDASQVAARTDTADLAARLHSMFGSRFELLRPIAIGGMATIFQMRHRMHNGLFVAKVLHPELVDKPGIVAGFRLEATHAARLGNHPNAVPVFDFGELDGLFFLLMPYIDGADLDRILLKAGPFSRDETLNLAAQVNSLLCHAEACGIVHGDLTPGNIRLDVYGHYRLLDLGISQATGVQTRPYTGGTPLYSSPEQTAGGPLDVRSDLYSLGAVLCECLQGTPVFLDSTLEKIQQRHRSGTWQMPTALKDGDPLARLLTMLLSTDPTARPASAYELSGILDALGWARPEFRPGPVDKRPFLHAPEAPTRKRLTR
ncbi:MAG: serine/threonine-protein kinase [Janthinobacterium lividum]